MSQYDLLPRSSLDAEKDRPRIRRFPSIFALLRKSRRVVRPLYVFIGVIVFLFWQTTFNASYINPPPFSIPADEKVFIAANIIDGDLITGAWGKSLLELVDLIGKERVFVSIYGGPESALKELGSKLLCNSSLVVEEQDPIALESIPHTLLPTGEERIKRIAYLAEVRNKALQPLQNSPAHFDKVLFINDVFFEAKDATRLLWGTNVKDGKSSYNAVCGADFVTSWKYYDTFATRDLEGYSIGVPIFPWFANEGDAVSRNDVLAGKDAVRVKSCWGGMVAFDAKYFMQRGLAIPQDISLPTLPLRFRSEPEPFWDSSECCLIHADIMSLSNLTAQSSFDDSDPGIYMNPFVRVAYEAGTFKGIALAKRFERLFALPQAIINPLAHMPRYNARRTEKEGQIIKDRLWVSQPASLPKTDIKISGRATLGQEGGLGNWESRGHYTDFERTAARGGYCGVRQLLVLKEGKLEEGEGNWDNLRYEVPPLE